MHPAPSLRDLTRAQTAAAHLALESTPLMRAFAEGAAGDADWREYLAGQWSLHAPLEAVLRPWVSPAWCRARLIKTEWLAADLLAMGTSPPTDWAGVFEIGAEAQALGTLHGLGRRAAGKRPSKAASHGISGRAAMARREQGGVWTSYPVQGQSSTSR